MEIAAQRPVTLAHVPLDLIDPPSTNCRSVASDVDDLARSIRVHGVLTPLRLRPLKDGRYEVVAGERRWRAAQLAGLTSVPAAIDGGLDELERLSQQLAENTSRLDLSELERVQAVQQLLELGTSDDEVAMRTGVDPEELAVLRRMAALPDETRLLLDEGALTVVDAAALAQIDDADVVAQALADIADGNHPRAAIDRAPERVRRRRIEGEARAKLEKQRIHIIDPPAGYDFPAASTTRQLGSGPRALHVDVKQHRREPCHAAYINPWARSARDAVVPVCTDVRRHAADPAAGVDTHLRLAPEEAKQVRAERRTQRKAWRQSHPGRREAAARVLVALDESEAVARVVDEVVSAHVALDDGVMALGLLGTAVVDELDAAAELHRRARSGEPLARLRVAVALLMARAEVAFAKEQCGGAAYRERENVRAHMRQLATHGYELSSGELAQLAEPFGIDGLEEPSPRRPWHIPANGDVEGIGTVDGGDVDDPGGPEGESEPVVGEAELDGR